MSFVHNNANTGRQIRNSERVIAAFELSTTTCALDPRFNITFTQWNEREDSHSTEDFGESILFQILSHRDPLREFSLEIERNFKLEKFQESYACQRIAIAEYNNRGAL